MQRNISLTRKVALSFVAVLLPILAFFTIDHISNKRKMESHLLDDMTSLAESVEAQVLLFIEMNRRRVEDFASDGTIRAALESPLSTRESARLGEYVKRHKLPVDKSFYRVAVLSAQGKVVASTEGGDVGTDRSAEEVFLKGIERPVLAEKAYGETGLSELVAAAPIRSSRDGRVIGVLAAYIDVSELSRLFSGERSRELGDPAWNLSRGHETFEVYLVNKSRTMITESRFVPDAVWTQKVDTAPVRACAKGVGEFNGFYKDYRGVEVAGASMCIPELGWTLVIEIDRSEAVEHIQPIFWKTLFTVLLITALIGALVIYFLRIVTGGLKGLVDATKEVASGNYDIKVPVKGPDEIGALAESFNTMAREIKARRKALEESEKSLANAQRIARLGNWEWDLLTGKVRWSDEVYRIFGLSPGEFDAYSWKFLDFVHRDDRLLVKNAVKESLNGKPFSLDFRVVAADGTVRFVHDSGEAVLDGEGRPVRMSGILHDITERKKAEDEVRKLNSGLERKVAERTAKLDSMNRELESFSYSVAHDLKAPLRVVDGFAKLLFDDLPPEARDGVREHIVQIRESSARMSRLIDDLLTLSKITRAEMTIEPVDLSGLVMSVANDLRKAHPEREVEVEAEPGLVAAGDQGLMRIALENLLGNAWKFTGRQKKARIEFGSMPDGAGEIRYFIKDNGAGFDMKYADRLFSPFQRLHSDSEFQGSGVGLATVARVISRHGGRVWAEGERGTGATFYFTIGLPSIHLIP